MVQYFPASMGALRLTAPGFGEPQAPPGYAVDEPRNSLAKNANAASGNVSSTQFGGCGFQGRAHAWRASRSPGSLHGGSTESPSGRFSRTAVATWPGRKAASLGIPLGPGAGIDDGRGSLIQRLSKIVVRH